MPLGVAAGGGAGGDPLDRAVTAGSLFAGLADAAALGQEVDDAAVGFWGKAAHGGEWGVGSGQWAVIGNADGARSDVRGLLWEAG